MRLRTKEGSFPPYRVRPQRRIWQGFLEVSPILAFLDLEFDRPGGDKRQREPLVEVMLLPAVFRREWELDRHPVVQASHRIEWPVRCPIHVGGRMTKNTCLLGAHHHRLESDP